MYSNICNKNEASIIFFSILSCSKDNFRKKNIERKKIIDILIWAESLNIKSAAEKRKDTILPFKLHQFISQTGYVYVTLENADNRHITLEPNPFVKLSESEPEVPVFQTVFSRVSGVEFICVRKDFSESKLTFRDFNENQNPKNEDDLKVNNGKKVQKVKNREN